MSKPANMLSAIEPRDLVANDYAETTMLMVTREAGEVHGIDFSVPTIRNVPRFIAATLHFLKITSSA
jgi:hypothetical protein